MKFVTAATGEYRLPAPAGSRQSTSVGNGVKGKNTGLLIHMGNPVNFKLLSHSPQILMRKRETPFSDRSRSTAACADEWNEG